MWLFLDLLLEIEMNGVEVGEMLDPFSHVSDSGISNLPTPSREVRYLVAFLRLTRQNRDEWCGGW